MKLIFEQNSCPVGCPKRGAMFFICLLMSVTITPCASSAQPSIPTALLAVSTANVTFGYTGAVQSWTVPTNVSTIAVMLYGAAGGGANCGNGVKSGGLTTTILSVSPGDTVYTYVGGRGVDYGNEVSGGTGSGGWNGGGDGGWLDLGRGAGGGGGAGGTRPWGYYPLTGGRNSRWRAATW